jgi:hypothetical protein
MLFPVRLYLKWSLIISGARQVSPKSLQVLIFIG